MTKFILTFASKFVTRRQALRWALNYLLGLLRKSRTPAQWDDRLQDITAIHSALGLVIDKLADGQVTAKEAREIEQAADAVFHELYSG